MLYYSKRKKINTHEHIQKGFDFKKYIQVMDTFNIEKVFLLATGVTAGNEGYEEHQEHLVNLKKEYSDRIEMFVTVAHSRDNCIEQFEDGLKYNPIGLKLMNGHPAFGEIPLNHPRLLPLFERCEKEGKIVLIHHQLNLGEDRWKALDDVLSSFPNVVFQLAHLGVAQKQFVKLASFLNKHKNLYMDCSWGGYFQHFIKQVDWEPERFKLFYTAYADRISWGTDQVMHNHTPKFLIWQHATEIASLALPKYKGWQKYFPKREVYGLGLDNDTLNKIFYETPLKMLTAAAN